MKINTSYPYPVLYSENDDYIDSSFDVESYINEEFGELKISTKFNLNNEGIKGLINDGVGSYLIHVECPQTSYRKAFVSVEDFLEINIPTNLLRGKLFLNVF